MPNWARHALSLNDGEEDDDELLGVESDADAKAAPFAAATDEADATDGVGLASKFVGALCAVAFLQSVAITIIFGAIFNIAVRRACVKRTGTQPDSSVGPCRILDF